MNSIFILFFLPSTTLSRPLPLPPTPPPHSTSLSAVPLSSHRGVASQNGNNINIVRARSLKNEEAYSYEYQDIGDKSSRVEAWGWRVPKEIPKKLKKNSDRPFFNPGKGNEKSHWDWNCMPGRGVIPQPHRKS
ncbi:hypothetical protein Fmac_001246 [Flemingia macrophylla]|uniref:Uncharacterized protein n=1 Tax=Flemingia macrophylla TaxID=520843 RepID=A0ABD1NGJ7_9FABA